MSFPTAVGIKTGKESIDYLPHATPGRARLFHLSSSNRPLLLSLFSVYAILWITKHSQDMQLGMLLWNQCPLLLLLWQWSFCLISLFFLAVHCLVDSDVSSGKLDHLTIRSWEHCEPYFCLKWCTKVAIFHVATKGSRANFLCSYMVAEALDTTSFWVSNRFGLALPSALAIMTSSHGE